jgi:hypothetical protein
MPVLVSGFSHQVIDLCKLPDRHFELLPIIEAALPLLCAPLAHLLPPAFEAGASAATGGAAAAAAAAGPGPDLAPEARARLSEALAAQWRGMLSALSRALAAALAVARSERAAAAASGDGGALAAEAIAASGLMAWDLPSMNLLMLALRWAAAGFRVHQGKGAVRRASNTWSGRPVGHADWAASSPSAGTPSSCWPTLKPPLRGRLINEAPADWCNPSIVPQAIADAAEAAALDEAAALLIPSLRPAARRVLRMLRPGGLAVLEGAGSAHSALAAADTVASALPGLLAAAARAATPGAGAGVCGAAGAAAAAWAAALSEALPAFGQGGPEGERRLAEVAVRGLAAAAAIAVAAEADGCLAGSVDVDALGETLVHLLAFGSGGGDGAAVGQRVASVQDAAYASMLALLVGEEHAGAAWAGDSSASRALQSGALRLVAAPAVAEHLATAGLAAAATRRAAAGLLLEAMQSGGAAAAHAALPWIAWADCHRGDPDALALADCLDAWAVQEPWEAGAGGAPGAAWSGRVQALVRGLFSKDEPVRAAAARRLLGVVAPEVAAEEAADPSAARGGFFSCSLGCGAEGLAQQLLCREHLVMHTVALVLRPQP